MQNFDKNNKNVQFLFVYNYHVERVGLSKCIVEYMKGASMKKVLEKSSKLILTGCVAFSMFAGQLEFLSAKEVEVNVAKDAEVITDGEDTVYGGLAKNINDGDDTTAWALGRSEFPTDVTLKLEKPTSVNKVVVKLGSADWADKAAVDVEILYAINGITDTESDWRSFSTKKEAQPLGSTVEFDATEVKSISHVLVRLSKVQRTDGSTEGITLWPSIREIEAYETQEEKISSYNNIASQATISTDGVDPQNPENLTDNDPSTLYKFHNDQQSDERNIDLSFDDTRTIDAFDIYFEHVDEEPFDYKFEYSILGRNGKDGKYQTLVDHQTANRTDNFYQAYPIEAAQYSDIRIVMHKTTNAIDGVAGNGWPAIAEFGIYGSEKEVVDTESIAYKKPVHTNSNRSKASSIVDGNTKTVWNGTSYPGYADIDLEANYNLSGIEVYTPEKGYSQYEIFTSLNGRDFTKLAEKSSTEACGENGEKYDATGTEARYVRIYVTYNSASAASSINEVRVFGEKSNTALQETPAVNVASYADTNYAAQLANITNQDTYDEVYGIIERRLGTEYKDWFTLEIAENPKGHDYDYYELSNVNGKIHIKGNNGVSLAMGLNEYLKYDCYVNISQVGDQVVMPESIVAVDGTVFKETKAKVRYAYNYCTLSYSMPFYGVDEWRAEMDWLALNGVNVVLDATGQEEVWRRFLGKVGYEHQDIKDFIAGPAYYAWAYMGNLSGFGGPVHDSWFEQRTELARQNQLSMRKLGMQPVLQGYSGMVPNDLAEHDADAANDVIKQGTWCSFQRPDMLKTDSETYAKYAKLFYESQKEVYGDITQYYATDPFHEGGITGGMSTQTVASKVLDSMLDFDNDAVWIIQSWQGNPSSGLLDGIDGREEHALILDLYADKTPHYADNGGGSYGNDPEFDGKPWVFCMLNNFGGRLGLHGHLDNLANNIPKVFNTQKYVQGIGITPEASVNNPLLYDFLFETVWTDDATKDLKVIDLDTWLNDYATRRYGAESKSAQEALKILKDTVYKASLNQKGQGAPESVANSRPAFNISAASTWGNAEIDYNKEDLEKAAQLLMEDYDKLKDSEGYRYDLATVLEQVLSNSAQESLKTMKAAYDSGSLEKFTEASNTFLSIIDHMDKVTSTSKYYLLGTWVNQAKRLADGTDDFTKELYELNAKSLITTWGSINQSESGGLHDYSNRQWSGLINDFYKARWQIWIDNRSTELETGESVSDPNWFTWEWTWARGDDEYTSTPTNLNLKDLGANILENFSVKNFKSPAEDTSKDIDVKTISVEAGDYEKTRGEEYGEGSPDKVLDGNTGTKWHTTYGGSDRAKHYLTFTLNDEQMVSGLRYLPRTDGGNGTITKYEVYIKNSESDDWTKVITDGKLDANDNGWQILKFDDQKEYMAKQVKFVVLDAVSTEEGNDYAALTEMRILKGGIIEADLTELNAAIANAEKLNKADYTTETWAILETALKEAKAITKDQTQKEVDAALSKLNDAVKGLKEVEKVDFTALEAAITAAEKLNKVDYTAETWATLETALKEAKAITKENTQKEVDAALSKLNDAVKGLKEVEKIDLTKLNAAIATAEKLNKADYTAETWTTLEAALKDAKTVLADKNADQKTIDKAVLALENAMNGLLKAEEEKPVEPEKPTEPDTPTTPDNNEDKNVITNHTETISVIGKVEAGTQLITKEYSETEVKELTEIIKDKDLLKNFTIEKAFDISLVKDGTIVKPDGTISVRIKVSADILSKDVKVVFIDDKGNVTDMVTRKGSDYIEFDTNHNSTYAIVSNNAAHSNGADTGDTTNVGMIFTLLMLSGGIMVVMLKKKKA